MDKFGIFKLLSSILNSATTENPTSEENGEGLANSSPTKPTKNHTTVEDINHAKGIAPIQSSMLSVLRNHDIFIRRVQKRNEEK